MTDPIATITRSFLSFVMSFMAVALSTSYFFKGNLCGGSGVLFALAQTGSGSTNCRTLQSFIEATAFDHRQAKGLADFRRPVSDLRSEVRHQLGLFRCVSAGAAALS